MDDLFQIFANTADGAFIVDQEQRIIYWNQAAQEMLGYTSDEVIGLPCYDVLKGRDDKGQLICHFHCPVSTTVQTGKAVPNYNLAARTRSGDVRWVNISILAFSNFSHNGMSVIVHLFRDATQLKQTEQFIHEMFDAVERWQQETNPAIPAPVAGPLPEALTDREGEVLSLLAQGCGTLDIARSLSISSSTVRNHIQSILHKLQVHSRLEAVAYAFEHGLVTRD